MAACAICSELNRKLHKRWYNLYKVFICTKCTIDFSILLELEVEDSINGHNQDSYNCA
jgi:hypothetical protein